jgi:hypothetical protein
MASKPKNWEELSEDEREAWRVKDRERRRKWRECNPEKVAESMRKYREANPDRISMINRKHHAKIRTQADADRFFQLMGAAEELTKIIKQRKDEQTEKMGHDE